MKLASHRPCLVAVLMLVIAQGARATVRDSADESIRQFLAQDDAQHAYRATRRLEARNGSRSGWIEAVTEYSTSGGFRYDITSEGGSKYIRSRVLRAVLDGERDLIAQGATARGALARENYTFESNGVDDDGLANILLSPRRQETVLIAGTMFLRPDDGALVRLQGRPAKNPSFWVKSVTIVRSYDRIEGVVLPVAMESHAQLRMLGAATLHMTYRYSEIDGRPVSTPDTSGVQ
jgi:hypothetical protein